MFWCESSRTNSIEPIFKETNRPFHRCHLSTSERSRILPLSTYADPPTTDNSWKIVVKKDSLFSSNQRNKWVFSCLSSFGVGRNSRTSQRSPPLFFFFKGLTSLTFIVTVDKVSFGTSSLLNSLFRKERITNFHDRIKGDFKLSKTLKFLIQATTLYP